MLLQLVFESFVSDSPPVVHVGILEHRHCQVIDLLFAELHSIFFHTSSHNVLQFFMLY